MPRLKPTLLRALGFLLALLLLVYAGDYLSLRYRIPHRREPFGTVQIQPLYAIHEKNGKTEYDFPPPETETCVHSLFPHFGYAPCWYLRRHTEKRIDI
jgi:hypothetical protein